MKSKDEEILFLRKQVKQLRSQMEPMVASTQFVADMCWPDDNAAIESCLVECVEKAQEAIAHYEHLKREVK